MGGGGVQRIVKFAKYLQSYGWQATVVCPTTNIYKWIDEDRMQEVKNIKIIRVPIDDIQSDMISRIRLKLRFIDAFYPWADKVVKQLLASGNHYDLVFTSGPPHSVHYVGRQLKRNRNIPWVADFRDPFILAPEYKPATPVHSLVNYFFEKTIYKEANAIIANTAINAEELLKTFRLGGLQDKLFSIYNGYDDHDLADASLKIENWDTNKINFLYLGGLRGDHIDGVFYKTLAKALEINPQLRNEIKINIVGDGSRRGSMVNELGLHKIISFYPPVAFDKVGAYLDKADAALTWQRDRAAYKGTIAGKLFDYIGKQLPIFSIGQKNGEIAQILSDYKIGLTAPPHDIEEASKQFVLFCTGIIEKSFQYTKKDQQSLAEKFNRIKQAEQLAKVFNKIMD